MHPYLIMNLMLDRMYMYMYTHACLMLLGRGRENENVYIHIHDVLDIESREKAIYH